MEKTIASRLNARMLLVAAISANGDSLSAIVDTQDIQTGLAFAMAITGYTDGDYDLVIEESSDSAFGSDVSDVPADQIYNQTATQSAAIPAADALPMLGVLYTKRYVRAKVVASSVTTGATATVFSVEHADEAPTS